MKHKNHKPNRNPKTGAPGSERRRHYDRKFWNWVRNEEPDSFGSGRTLYLDGEISDETWFGDEVTPKLFSDELHAGDGNHPLDQLSGR